MRPNAKDLISVSRLSLRVAVGGVALAFVAGFWLMRADGQPVHEAAFVAAAMVATSAGITARVLRDLNVLRFRVSRIVLGAAVFDDMLGMILLGIVVSVATGAGIRWLHLGLVVGGGRRFCRVHDLFRSPPGTPHTARTATDADSRCSAGVGACHLPWPFRGGHQNRHGRHHRRLFRRPGVCRLLAGMEPGTARAGNQPVSLAVLFLHHGCSPATLGLLARAGCHGLVHFPAGDYHQDVRLRPAAHSARAG